MRNIRSNRNDIPQQNYNGIHNGQTNNQPIFQMSGIEPNYQYKGQQNLPFDASSIPAAGFSNKADLTKAVTDQQQFVNNYNTFNPKSDFLRTEVNSSKLENLRDFSQFNIEKTFEKHQPIEKMLDTKYKQDTIYNNLNDNLLKEALFDIRINIDSIDRDVQIYPDPFNYVINFGPVVNSGINASVSRSNLKQELKSVNKKNRPIKKLEIKEVKEEIFIFKSPELIKEYTINLINTNNPYINRDFDNIKFIRLDAGVIPKYNSVQINSCWDFCRKKSHQRNFIRDDYDRMKDYVILNYRYIPDDTEVYTPIGDRFIQIYIKELNNNYSYGTNPITDQAFILIYDKNLGALYFRCIPYSAVLINKDSLLGNIRKLSIQFFDSWGNPITLNTSQINYEKDQILETDIINPEKFNLEEYIDNPKIIEWFIEKMNEIIKCFVMINFDIKYKIPFYNSSDNDLIFEIKKNKNIREINKFLNITSSKNQSISSIIEEELEKDNKKYELLLNDNCYDYKNIKINQSVFMVENIYLELNDFVSVNGFIEAFKTTKSGKKVKISINNFINNVIWFDNEINSSEKEIKYNIEQLDFNYRNFGFDILDTLKTELINLPSNKMFQNFLTFVIGQYNNELNTKIDYYK